MYSHSKPVIPNLSGCICTALFAEETWLRGRCQRAYNAFYMHLNGDHWHRFRVTCGGVSWKVVDSPQHPPQDKWDFRLKAFEDSDIIGNRIHKIEYWQREPFGYDPNDDIPIQFYDDSAIRIQFANGFVVEIRYHFHDLSLNSFHLTPNQARRKNRYERAGLLDTSK